DRRYQTIGDLLADLRRSLVHPDEDFVVIAPLVDNGKTKVISGEELKQIKEHGGEPKEDRHASKLESSYDPDEDEDDEDED
ncbi:serine/threonine protein kinase, partial [Xanthomonas citri pv. citri]|nr:serine/threonine protein kinase [Xanthomonas citri pv. citri]